MAETSASPYKILKVFGPYFSYFGHREVGAHASKLQKTLHYI